jgi:hypothetical protein
MQFASMRGYGPEDFVDPSLVRLVGEDFKNSMNSPEFERMKAIAQRRTAYTGGLTPSAGSGGIEPPAAPSTLDRMASSIMSRRVPG